MKNVDSPVITIGSFCSGIGWLDIAVKLACEHVGIRTKSMFASEWDSYAAAVLRSRMEESSLEPCPIWCGDLRGFPSESFRGVVDAAVFGFPCQDISCAGQGSGIRGKRSGVFFDILAKCCDMGCQILFLENVAAITTRGLDTVLGTLSDCGFHAEWTTLSAAEVGASHKRERWFCVAYRDGDSIEELIQRTVRSKQQTPQRHDSWGCDSELANSTIGGLGELREPSRRDGQPDREGVAVADSRQPGFGGERLLWSGSDGGSQVVGTGEDVDDSAGPRRNGSGQRVQQTETAGERQQAGMQRLDIGRGGMGHSNSSRADARSAASRSRNSVGESGGQLFAPGPGDFDGWGRVVDDGSFKFRAPSVKPGVRVLVDGITVVVDQSRADQLRCSGNGVVVLQAATAFVGLMRRLGIGFKEE